MRTSVLPCLLLVISGGSICCGQQTFPYRLTLGHGPVQVRSGPGESFYVTGNLPEGDSVDVYQHHEDGWLGIRPPAGSFSWVPAAHLTGTDQAGIGRIVRDDTICRVGSRAVEVEQHVGQIYLENGELVELLDDLRIDTRTARRLESEGWRRISPPAGEFRWVRASDIQRATRPRVSGAAQASAPQLADGGSVASGVQPAAHWQASLPESPGLTTAQVIRALAVESREESADEVDEVSESQDEPGENTSSDRSAEDGFEGDPHWAARGTAKKLSAFRERSDVEDLGDPDASWSPQRNVPMSELLDVEMRLAMTAAREIHLWRLQPLRDRVESIQPRLKTDVQREQAKALLERIAEYETLQNRFAVAGENASPNAFGASGERTGAVAPPGWEDSLLSRFDGNGWLVPVHSVRGAAPPYALLDAEGEVLFYVAPSPGLNLHRYLRKRVGLYGPRIANQTLNKPIITAERVVDLGRHLN